jgi:hypothetical protein
MNISSQKLFIQRFIENAVAASMICDSLTSHTWTTSVDIIYHISSAIYQQKRLIKEYVYQ